MTIPASTPKSATPAAFVSMQPMGSLFEQCLLIALDCVVMRLMEKKGAGFGGDVRAPRQSGVRIAEPSRRSPPSVPRTPGAGRRRAVRRRRAPAQRSNARRRAPTETIATSRRRSRRSGARPQRDERLEHRLLLLRVFAVLARGEPVARRHAAARCGSGRRPGIGRRAAARRRARRRPAAGRAAPPGSPSRIASPSPLCQASRMSSFCSK